MKKINLLALLLMLVHLAFAQNAPKRYITLEHFTNSRCSNCASQNPGFFSVIANFEDDVHHIAYHPPYPYNSCLFYQANTAENTARATFYNLTGTPRVFRNGLNGTTANQITAAMLQSLQGQTSPIALTVTETSGNTRQATIDVYTDGDAPTGNLRLFAAIVEREIDYTSPNGETVHHNVFRKMLTNIAGDPFTAAATGNSVVAEFTYSLENNWNADEIYVLAFVQNVDTKEVLNSGTRFDPIFTSTKETSEAAAFEFYPNPTKGAVTLRFAQPVSGTLSLLNIQGKHVYSKPLENEQNTMLDMTDVPAGCYVLQVQTAEGISVRQLVRY